jgi:transposase
MEKEVLARMLEEGLSQSEIGRRVGVHQSTVSYWCHRHGLTPARPNRHAARGAIDRETLTELVARNLTVRGIATTLDRSPTTVRYWLRRYDLRTTDEARRATGRYARRRVGECRVHGITDFITHRDGSSSCARCRAESVTRWRRRAKAILVAEAGGSCAICGYDRCLGALEFHHRDPAEKRFNLGGRGLARAIDVLREEAAKCVLLCSNCHTEVETGFVDLPS